MDNATDLTDRLANRIRTLRQGEGLSLEAAAARSGVSRATIARIEAGQTSPTAETLGALAAAYGIAISRLLADVETPAAAFVPAADQPRWTDPKTGFRRRNVSPPGFGLAAEMIEGELPEGAAISYDRAPRPHMEHHLYLLAGGLEMTVDGKTYRLQPGDALRWRLMDQSSFLSLGPGPARYILAIV